MQDTTSMVIQQSNGQRTESDGPEPVVMWDQANGLAREGLAHVDRVPFPLDLSIGAYSTYGYSGPVVRSTDTGRIGLRRWKILAGWRLLSQRFMRPLGVVALTEGVESSLLLASGRPRRTRCLCLERPVQPLQASVLLWVAGVDTLRYDTQLDPPHGKRRQASQTNAGEGWSVIRADGSGQSILSEGALQDLTCLRTSGPRQVLADQQEARCGVLHGQRVAPHSVCCAEPPLEVDRPHVVGVVGSCKRRVPGRSMSASFTTSHQPCPVQDLPRRAGRRPRLARFRSSQPRHQLLRAPRRTGLSCRNQPLGHCARGSVGMAMRSSATVPQPLPAICLKAPDTLVAGLATNAKLAAHIHEAYSPCLPSLDEAYLLGFEVRLFPGQHNPPDGIAPIFAQCVTHVPGLYPL